MIASALKVTPLRKRAVWAALAETDAETVRGLAAELGIPMPGVDSRMRRGLAGALRQRARALVA